MLDFLLISTRSPKKGITEIYPKFIAKDSSDLMIRGGDFYAIYDEETQLWSTKENDAVRLIDKELDKFAKENEANISDSIRVLHLWDTDSGMIDKWHKYCQKQMWDQYKLLDDNLVFSNMTITKESYASKKLKYPLKEGSYKAFDTLISKLYSPEEKRKIEWAIGAIVSGESKFIQKFMVLYGSGGTGKSTILRIIEKLFEGYCDSFDAKALGQNGSSFALEAFKSNPLVAIQDDGNLSKIEDNTRLNSLVSHETMRVNEKYKSTYSASFRSFLILGTNSPVKITDAKSGLIRRLIDVSPTGEKFSFNEYNKLMQQIDFELGAIAYHCLQVFNENPGYYDGYIPLSMLSATNDFYNFVEDSRLTFEEENGVSLQRAWDMYKNYCEEANVQYKKSKRIFQEELKNYFREFKERHTLADGTRVRSYYYNFRAEKIDGETFKTVDSNTSKESWINLKEQSSIFDKECSECPAQYASADETPQNGWDFVKTTLTDINTNKLHYVRVPLNHIVIDFDIQDKNGEKSLELNLKAAQDFPPTYVETSKSGKGLHLHYIYEGDVSKLDTKYSDHIEVKVFNGKSSLRRKLLLCNTLAIATISSGLPFKKEKPMIDIKAVKSEEKIRELIKNNFKKQYHPGTKPSVDFIYKILEDAYTSGLHYDVSDMYDELYSFCLGSTHQREYCLDMLTKMKLKSDEPSVSINNDEAPLVFFDCEVFSNLFVLNWKLAGEDKKVIRMINPKPAEVEKLLNFRLVGFNCRKYDNHIIYARLLGWNNRKLYELSQKLVSDDKELAKAARFGEAYNLSYTDIYDFCSKKQSLKKWEIELGIHHQELGLPWDKPVAEKLWELVAEYCDNDVRATEAVFYAREADFSAREILVDIVKKMHGIDNISVNDTTNTLSTRIIFGKNKSPQNQFNYRDLGEVSNEDYIVDGFDEYTRFNKYHQPVFPGYEFSFGKSYYRDELVGEGGYVYAEPGMHGNVALLDIASMHPSSIIAELLFGELYTKRFQDIKDARVAIKHKDYDTARGMLDGALNPYIDMILDDQISNGDLAQALKIVINSIYGLTKATYNNEFKDPRNVDNIVAKRGALFMINLKHEVQKRGYTVAHIKTDSIKIPDADNDIIKFVMDYGKLYGYVFEFEAVYDRMCLVNDTVYIAKYKDPAGCKALFDYIPGENEDHAESPWTATGTQFAVPYVFKTLFSHEPIEFSDICETKSVGKGTIYLDMNENKTEFIFNAENSIRDKRKIITKLKRKNPANPQISVLENEIEQLSDELDKAHNYIFVGNVGLFCPVREGCGGGALYRFNENKYYAVTGTKGYRWLEAEVVKANHKEACIDTSYYDVLVDKASKEIRKYGDLDWFISEEPYIPKSILSVNNAQNLQSVL